MTDFGRLQNTMIGHTLPGELNPLMAVQQGQQSLPHPTERGWPVRLARNNNAVRRSTSVDVLFEERNPLVNGNSTLRALDGGGQSTELISISPTISELLEMSKLQNYNRYTYCG